MAAPEPIPTQRRPPDCETTPTDPVVSLPIRVEEEHLAAWRHLYLHHFPLPADPSRCNEPSCGAAQPCWFGVHAKASLLRVTATLPTLTDAGHPDHPHRTTRPM